MSFLKDIRLIQIATIGSLLSYGVWRFDFSLSLLQVGFTFFVGLMSQYFWIKKLQLKKTSLLSAFISCLGIVILLRSNNLWIHPLAGVIAVNSKFFIQYKKQHFFNPSALGIFFVLFLPDSWLSPGQWGSLVPLSVWLTAIGFFIVRKTRFVETSWLFLLFYLGAVLLRNIWLSYEIEVFYHTALKGSLLLFAFFMISDPRTAPNHFMGQIIFTFFVAIISVLFQYYYYEENALIYALILASCLTPLVNRIFPAKSFEWKTKEV